MVGWRGPLARLRTAEPAFGLEGEVAGDDGKLHEVKVDAGNGQVIQQEAEDGEGSERGEASEAKEGSEANEDAETSGK